MKYFKNSLAILFACSSYSVLSQSNSTPISIRNDTVTVNELNTIAASNPEKNIGIALQANTIAKKINYRKGLAVSFKYIGIGYYRRGQFVEAVSNYDQSLKAFEKIHDEDGQASILNNIGALFMDQGVDDRALEYLFKSLALSKKINKPLRILTALNNIGGVYFNKPGTHDQALPYFLEALPLSEKVGDEESVGTLTVNLGQYYAEKGNDSLALYYLNKSVKAFVTAYPYNELGKLYAKKGDFKTALKYHETAYNIAKKQNVQLDMVQSLLGLADLYSKQNQDKLAQSYFSQAEVLARQIPAYKELQIGYDGLAASYARVNDYKKAFLFKEKYSGIKDTLFNIETARKQGTLQLKFDLSQQQNKIELQSLDLKTQKNTRNALAVGVILLLAIAFVIYRSYRSKAKTNIILDRQKLQIENLMLNILPAEVATELQVKGSATPRHYNSASVLFTDFKSFTSLADKLSPQELLAELNDSFVAFDDIIEKNDLEKIKTIGDAYMCAGGIPTPDDQHAFKIVKAGLEMQQYIIEKNNRRISEGLPAWELRIGIHVGPVVAGVVGKKKYAYDIWGNTVNIASRMESNGVPGRVNISSTTYELVKERFSCTHRGKIMAKNVGEIDMYFVDGEIQTRNEFIVVEHKLDQQETMLPASAAS